MTHYCSHTISSQIVLYSFTPDGYLVMEPVARLSLIRAKAQGLVIQFRAKVPTTSHLGIHRIIRIYRIYSN
jgi:hypothetical protein